ncbi:MAG: arylsulfatase, partial [Planctomycetota bacterium]
RYPTQYNGNEILPLEGKSLLPVLRGESREGHASLFFEHEGGRAVRQGDWKLVALARGEWELYNLASDRTETKNLAGRYPERVRKMAADWVEWAHRVGRKLDANGRPVRQ